MAVDITTVCALSSENQSSQELALWLSVLFSIYTLVSIMLSALTIYTSSQVGPPGAKQGKPRVDAELMFAQYAGDGPDGIPLLAMSGHR